MREGVVLLWPLFHADSIRSAGGKVRLRSPRLSSVRSRWRNLIHSPARCGRATKGGSSEYVSILPGKEDIGNSHQLFFWVQMGGNAMQSLRGEGRGKPRENREVPGWCQAERRSHRTQDDTSRRSETVGDFGQGIERPRMGASMTQETSEIDSAPWNVCPWCERPVELKQDPGGFAIGCGICDVWMRGYRRRILIARWNRIKTNDSHPGAVRPGVGSGDTSSPGQNWTDAEVALAESLGIPLFRSVSELGCRNDSQPGAVQPGVGEG
jgi:hypothetical protein